MKKIFFSVLIIFPCCLFAQIGIKAGPNFSNVTGTSSISYNSQAGYNIGIFLEPPSKSIMSSKTELIYSKQGFSYASGANTGNVNLSYIMLPTYMCFNITKYFQIHLGMQLAYLINAKADSTASTGEEGDIANPMQYFNHFDYGYGGGLEVRPVKGLIIGARLNISLADLYSDVLTGQSPTFSSENLKNNLFQLYVGWRFGKNEKKKEKERN